MKKPLDYDEQPSDEWKKLKMFVTASSASQTNSKVDNEFEQNVVTKILISSLTTVPVPDSFEDEVLRRIAAEAEPTMIPANNWDKIVSVLRTKTITTIGVIALISGGTLSIYTLTQNSVPVAPLLQNIETAIDLSPVPVQIETRFDKQTTQQKSKNPIFQPDTNKLPITGKKIHQPSQNDSEEDLF